MKYYWTNPDWEYVPPPKPIRYVRRELTDILLQIYCRKNYDGTKHLSLPGNYLLERIDRKLDHLDLPIISEFLNKHREVNSVELSYNTFNHSSLDGFMKKLIENKCDVFYLGLMNCSLTRHSLKVLSTTIGQTNITCLRINHNDFEKNSGHLIADMVISSRLTYLDVGGISSDWGLMGQLCGALKMPGTVLMVLDVSRIIPHGACCLENGDVLGELLEILIETCPTLQELHSRHNSLDGHNIEGIARAMKNSKNLLYLDLAGNRIGDLGAEYLADALLTVPHLLGLDISNNIIGEIGARALGHAVPFSKLRMLDVSLNRMCFGGLRILLHCIKKPQFMRILSVWGNKFDNDTSLVLYRMQISGIVQDECIDVRAVKEDGVYRVAQMTNSAHMRRHRYNLVRVPPVNPMYPIIDPPRKLKVDCTDLEKMPPKPPCPRPEVIQPPRIQFFERGRSYSSESSQHSDNISPPCLCREQRIKTEAKKFIRNHSIPHVLDIHAADTTSMKYAMVGNVLNSLFDGLK